MSNIVKMSLFVAALACVGACGGSKSAEKKDAPATTENADMKNNMGNCPAAVANATTEITDAADGIVVVVKSADAAATTEIRARAARLSQSANASVTGAHNRAGGSGGGAGHCPVVLKDTTVTAEDVDGGTKITVKPAKPEGLETLKTESRAKLTALPEMMKKAP